MNRRLVASCVLACAALTITGCDSGRQSPPKTVVRVVNAAPGFVTLGFQREQDVRNIAELSFKGTGEFIYDVDTYDFFVIDPSLPGNDWTFAPQLQADTGYTFVLTEVGSNIVPVVLAYPEAPATQAQIVGLHAAGGLPALDLYLEAPGVGIAGATPRGTFDVQGQIAPVTLPNGDYELTLTAAGDPTAVLLTTTTIELPAGQTTAIVVVPEGGAGTQQMSVLLVNVTASVLYDRNATAELRVINAAADQMPRDVAVDNQFSPPLFSAVPFAEPTAYAATAVKSQPIAVTPVGNPGVLELNQTFTPVATQRATMLVAGPAGTLTHAFAVDDGRRLHNEAKLRFLNAATQFTGVDFVLTVPGGDHTAQTPLAGLISPAVSAYGQVAPGEYDLYLRQSLTTTVLSGPTRITVAAGGVYGVLAVNGADATTAGAVLIDDFP